MAKININLDLDDQILDEAAIQAIKNKVRAYVQSEVSQTYKQIIEDTIKTSCEGQAMALKAGLNGSWGYAQAKEDMRKMIRKKMADMAVSEETLLGQIDVVMQPVKAAASAALKTIAEQKDTIDKEIKHQVERQVNATFRSTLSEMLMKAAEAQK